MPRRWFQLGDSFNSLDPAGISSPGPGETLSYSIPDSPEGIDFEIDRMVSYVQEAMTDPDFIEWAGLVVSQVQEMDEVGELRAIQAFIQATCRFTRDPYNTEKIRTPNNMMRRIREVHPLRLPMDCDEFATLAAAMAAAVGNLARFMVARVKNGYWSHIWGQAKAQGKWYHLDATIPGFNRRDRFYKYGIVEIFDS